MRVPSGGRTVAEIGEFPLIDIIHDVVGGFNPRRLRLGIGDDAAIWSPRPSHDLVVTTDTLIQGVHFRLEWIEDWQSLGHKALAVNLSDIASMGVGPRLAVVGLGLPGGHRDREVADLFRGMTALARRFGVVIAGGDVTSSPLGVVISVTVIGEYAIGGRLPMTRSASRPGDLIGVTGPLGLAAAGLRVLYWQQRTLDGNPVMQEAYHRPQPRVREGLALRRAGVRAAMDLSDGLLGDLPKMCQRSQVSAIVEEARLPIPNALKWSFPDWFDLATRGGDDYELLFTAPPHVFERVRHVFRRSGFRAPQCIGEITEAGTDGPAVQVRTPGGKLNEVAPGAFSHFGG